MNRNRKYWSVIAAALTVAAVVACPATALADFQLSWSADNTYIGNDPTNTVIVIPVSYTTGQYKINGSAAGNALLGDPTTARMDLSTITITSSAPGILTLYLTQNNLPSPNTGPTGSGILSETLTGHFLSGTGTVSMVAYGNDNNLLYGNATGQAGTSPAVGPPTNVMTASVGLNQSASVGFLASDPYSMTEIITIEFAGKGAVSLSSDGSAQFSTTPAPAGLVLLLTGSPVLGLGWRLRRRKATVA